MKTAKNKSARPRKTSHQPVKKKTFFYHFNQNNSGGFFTLDEKKGITHHVVIEGLDIGDVTRRAEEIGLYWDGVDNGPDCPCCGDRWCKPWSAKDMIDSPKVYDKSPEDFVKDKSFLWMEKGREVAVHYLNGKIEWF